MNTYQTKRVLAALDCEDKLTAWEWDFINNLVDHFDDRDLTDRQNEILNRIAEKTGR